MYRVLMCAAAALFIGNQAVAQEKVSFPSTDGTTLTGYLYKPTGSGPFAAVVGPHGCDGLLGDSDNFLGKKGEIHPLYGQWGEILSRAGYMVLLVDSFQSRGHGSLCGFLPVETSPVLPYREMPRDAFGGMNYLRSRPDVRPGSIAILGQSYGGNATMLTIANGALPKAVPPEKYFRAAIVFYPGCVIILRRGQWGPRQPMLFLMGELDATTAQCKEVIAKKEGGPPIDAHFYPNTYHAFDHPNLPPTVITNGIAANPEARADAINRVTQFLSKQLP